MIVTKSHLRHQAEAQAVARLAARLDTIRVIAGSLTPTTLAAAIIDLDENHGLTEADDQERLRARELFAEQLVCMIGEDEATRVLGGLPPSDGDLDIAARECAKETDQISSHLLESIATTVAY